MKKALCFLFLLLVISFAKATGYRVAATPVRQTPEVASLQIKHPQYAISQYQLNRIVNRMRMQKNDAGKKYIFKSSLKTAGITVEQLTLLLNQFLLDNSKLDCAIYAYPHTVDYTTYARIEYLFAEQKNKESLEDYLKRNKE